MISEDEQTSFTTEPPVSAHNNNDQGSQEEAMLEEVSLRRLMPSLEQLQVSYLDSHRL